MSASSPKVGVITPVYNGAKYIAAAIESVRAQTHDNWEYVIADNCSTDETRDIVAHFAALDPRIRLYTADSFLPIIANWNRALRQVPVDAKYCKVLHADDCLMPECLGRMVALMEQYPSVGIAGSYVLYDREVECDGLPIGQSVWPGHEICRNTLLGSYYLFGSPSSLLIRADLVHQKPAGFYNEDNLHADFEVCYEILEKHDFGFIHQVLSFTRTHAGSMGNTFSRFYNPQLVEYLGMMRKYGPKYLDRETYERLHRDMLRTYRRLIARRLILGRGHAYWKFHKSKLAHLGYRFGGSDLFLGFLDEISHLFVNPAATLKALMSLGARQLRGHRW